ncbi:hypothetical protein ACFSNO_21600 [Streptomyces cirratus]|nr:hypothetical protein [Streptomyces cirratus]
MPRRDLPPPPPPAHLREWLDESVVRADRARFLQELGRCILGPGRLLTLWAVAAVFALGWSLIGMALRAVEGHDPLSYLFGLVYAALGAGVLVPAVIWFAKAAERDRQLRHLLCAWAESDRDPAAAALVRAPWRSLTWLLTSVALGALGLWVTFAAAAEARPGEVTYGEVTYFMGLGLILWITALLGLGKAGAHHRWSVRAFGTGDRGVSGQAAGGSAGGGSTARSRAPRSASRGHRPRGSGSRSPSAAPGA